VAPDAGLSQPEAALFLHDNNQQAFINGDINRLKASATLMLPARGHSEAYQAEDALDQFLDRANGKAGPRPPASVVSTSPVQARDVEPGTPEASFPDLAPAISPEAYRQADVPVQDRLRVEGVDEVEAGSEVALPSGESPGEDPSVEALNQALQAAEATNRALEERIANLESQIKVMLADNSSGQGAVPPSGSPVSIDAEAMASTVDRDNEVQSSILAMLKNMMMPLLIGLGGLALLVLAVLLRRRGKKPSDGLAGLSVRAPEKVTEANDDENIQGDVEDGLASFDDVPAGASARRRVGIKADARTPDIHADDKAEPADRATVARSPVTEGRRPVAPRTPPLPPVEETPTPVPVVPTDDVMLDQDLAEDRTGAEPSRQAEEQVDEATRTTGTIETVAGEAAIADTGAVETSPEVRAEQSRDPVSDAEVYLSFGQMGNARKLLEQTLESNPDDERVRARLMELLVSCERVEDARVHYDRLRGSGDADIQERCAALKEAFGDFEVQHHADLSGEPPVESPANQPPIDVSLSEADDSLQGLENHLPEEISLDAEDGPVAPVDAETTSGEDHRAKPLVFEEDSELGVAIATSEGEPLRDSVDNESLQHLFDDLGLDDNKNVTASPAESETPAELAPDPDLELPDTDVSAIAGNDTATTKLDLASAYIDMGDLESAREMLEEVLEEGNESQKARARSLLDNFGD
jgi:pilus assembly protein FimV